MNLGKKIAGFKALLELALKVKRENRKSLSSQLFEILFLRLAKNKLGLEEYYDFRVYDDTKHSWDDKLRFVGCRKEAAYQKTLNPRPWNVITSDKLVAYAIFEGLRIPYPRVRAIYHPFGRRFPDAESITEEQELASYLRTRANFPFFSKPAHGASGRNSVVCTGYDAETDSLILGSGALIKVEEYVKNCYPIKGVFPWEAGFIFQDLVRPAEEWQKNFGSKVAGFRMVVLNPDERPRIFRALLKVPTAGKSMTDNFDKGETGTLLAKVNAESGMIEKVRSGVPPYLEDIECHPDTGVRMIGFKIPDWQQYVDLVDYAARAFPGVRLQHWDIAVSDRGPVAFELNTFGGFGLPQMGFERGYFDEDFESFFEGLGKKYPEYRGPGDY